MLKRVFQAYRIMTGQFRQYFSLLLTLGGFLFLNLLMSAALKLDKLFFPRLKTMSLNKPVVIVGNPRSGTTFLQRFMVDQQLGAGMRVWKMLYPSLTLQMLVRPFLPILEKFSPARHHSKAAHETSLTSVETDDPSFLFRFFDGFFLYGFFFAWSKEDTFAQFDPRKRDTSERDFNWLEQMWLRNLISERQDRVVAKLFSLSVRLPAFLRRFPDAKVLYMIRDPLQTVPSGLSLVTGVLDARFGFWSLPHGERQHYIDKLYQALLELSLRFHEDYVAGRIPQDKLCLVPFPRLMQDFDGMMNDILAFIETKPTPGLERTIQQVAVKQRQYRSEHEYDLKRFGLTEERIRQDYAVIYETFLQPEQPAVTPKVVSRPAVDQV